MKVDRSPTAPQLCDVEVIAEGRLLPMRLLAAPVAIGGITAAVKYIAPTYGARQEVPREVLRECIDIAFKQFSHLGPAEILQAYRLWAAERIQGLEMWGGQFNATQFARVLSAYNRYRLRISRELAAQEAETQRETMRLAREEAHRKRYEATVAGFPAALQAEREEGTIATPADVPRNWYQLAELHGLIEYAPGEKLELCRLAERIVLAEQAAERRDATSIVNLRRLTSQFERLGLTPIFTRAQQLAIWSKLLGRALPEPTA